LERIGDPQISPTRHSIKAPAISATIELSDLCGQNISPRGAYVIEQRRNRAPIAMGFWRGEN